MNQDAVPAGERLALLVGVRDPAPAREHPRIRLNLGLVERSGIAAVLLCKAIEAAIPNGQQGVGGNHLGDFLAGHGFVSGDASTEAFELK